jgi:hypothetical protein
MEGEEERFVKGTVSGVRLLFLCVYSSRWSILGTLTSVCLRDFGGGRCYREAASSLDTIELDAKEYTDELSDGEEEPPC